MKSGSHSNALLVELLIVVLFFMISATFLMQIFSAARMQGEKSGALIQASRDAQNIAENLAASVNPADVLKQMGFTAETADTAVWKLDENGYTKEVVLSVEKTEGGTLLKEQVIICKDGETLIELPVAGYREEQS